MAIDYQKLLELQIPETRHSYTHKDSILYALSLGYCSDPMDAQQLPLVYEDGLRAIPTMGIVLAHPGFWPRDLDTGLDPVRIVHAEQGLTLHKPLPAQAQVIGQSRIVDIIDRGPEKGALITCKRRILEAGSGELLCTVTQVLLARGDGGFGGPQRSAPAPHVIPERPAEHEVDLQTPENMALLYRLNGDWNPLHADPQIARQAGFQRPILQGLATWGLAVRAILQTVCAYDVTQIASVFGRFTAPAYPGETFRTEIWVDGLIVSFRVRSLERDVTVINHGRVELRG